MNDSTTSKSPVETGWPSSDGLLGASVEDNVVGTWFARLGVLALLIGAAFGYRYAVDQGLIGPAARLALGTFLGGALIGCGHWARGRKWFNFAHALSGGGVATLFLVVLAAQHRFELITPGMAVTLLTGVALLSVWLALKYDSLALAVLALVGAFLNPFFLAAHDPTSAWSYLIGVDVGVVYLAFYRRWSSLNKLALAGTVAVAGYIVAVKTLATLFSTPVSMLEDLAFSTVLWVLFSLIPFIQAVTRRSKAGLVDAGLTVSVGLLYMAGGLFFLDAEGAMAQGSFALVVGLVYGVVAWVAHAEERTREPLAYISGALSVGSITLAAPLMADGPVVHLMWLMQGTLLLYVAGRLDATWSRVAAGGLIAVGTLGTVETISTYTPSELFVTPPSIALALQIAVLYAAGIVVSRDDSANARTISQGLYVVANLLTLGWLSREASFEVLRAADPASRFEIRQFVLSGLWAGYAGALMATGVAMRQRWARYLGLVIFALTLVKMLTVDLWQLETLQRTYAFIGLGLLMIGLSFIYNRFRDMLVGSET